MFIVGWVEIGGVVGRVDWSGIRVEIGGVVGRVDWAVKRLETGGFDTSGEGVVEVKTEVETE